MGAPLKNLDASAPRQHDASPAHSSTADVSHAYDWQPAETAFTVFMTNHVTCPVCLISRTVGVSALATRLHVRRVGLILTITEADDLHNPGRLLQAQFATELPTQTIYQLLNCPVGGVELQRFRSAAGMVTVSGRLGRLQLRAWGVAESFCCREQRIFDAVEDRS